MFSGLTLSMSDVASPTPTERFASLIERLMQDVAGDVPTGWLPIPLVRLMWRRLRQLNARFLSVLARFRAGTLPKPATPPPPGDARRGPPPADPPSGSQPSHGPRPHDLPRRIGWAFRKISWARFRRDELQDLLDDPEMAILVADAPQLGRTLRPLCRMLGVTPPAWLLLPHRPRAKKPPRPRPTLIRVGASELWRGPNWMWPTREEAEKHDAKIWIWPDER
jgi:hypothetical protein